MPTPYHVFNVLHVIHVGETRKVIQHVEFAVALGETSRDELGA
jgi:hypothetical protein